MYRILGNRYNDEFEDFITAFKYQQKYHPEKKIICKHNDGLIEIVWEPSWTNYTKEHSRSVIYTSK